MANKTELTFCALTTRQGKRYKDQSPVQVKNFVSVYIDRDSDRDSVRDRDKNNREKNYIDRVRDAK